MTTQREHLDMILAHARGGKIDSRLYIKHAYLHLIELEALAAIEDLVVPAPPMAKEFHYLVSDDHAAPLQAGRCALEPHLRPEMEAKGAIKAYCVYASDVGVNQSTGAYTPGNAKVYVEYLVPMGYTGIILYDVESEIKKALHDESDSIKHELALDVFHRLYDESKEARPDAMVGFYGLPVPYYWRHPGGDGVAEAVEALKDVRNDFWSPNIYDLSLEDVDSESRHDRITAYHASMFTAIEHLHERPIYPTVWERIDSRQSAGNKRLIPDWEIIRDQVLFAFEHGSDGLLWWGKNGRVAAQGSWGAWLDCRGMPRPEAEQYLLTDLPRRLANLFLDACETWSE